MEIDAKFAITDRRVVRRLTRARRLAGYALGDGRGSRDLDTYLDTRGRSLLAAGLVCRARRHGDGRLVVTLRELGGAAGTAQGRGEYEVTLPNEGSGLGAAATVGSWPDGPARSRVLPLVGQRPLVRLAIIRRSRIVRPVARDGRVVATLHLDRGHLRAGRAGAPFAEVEVKRAGKGKAADLERVAACLRHEWGLPPEPGSKLARVLALAGVGSARAGTRIGITAADPMAEAARRILAFHLGRMARHEGGAREGQDLEALHDMRVATRRMRAALRTFAPHLDQKAYKPFRKALRRTGAALGAVRDLDVFREKTDRYLQTLPEERRSGLDPLLAAWRAEHDRAREAMLAFLDGEEYGRFKKEVGRFLKRPGAGAPRSDPEVAPPHRVSQAMPALVVAGYAAVRAYEDHVTSGDAPLPRFHRLRIAAKRLRYTLEFFQEVLPTGARPLIEHLKALQDHLGDLQDAVVTCGILRDFLAWGTWGTHRPRMPEMHPVIVAPGVATYLSVRQDEIRKLLDGFPAVWATVSGTDFRRRLFAAVSGV
jgi:CHAD domain-containing protein